MPAHSLLIPYLLADDHAATHQTTTQQLESVSRENYPVYMLILSDELRNENSQIHTRNAASLALNNALSARATTLQDGWPSMSMLDRRSRRASPSDAFKQAALALRPLLSRNAKTTDVLVAAVSPYTQSKSVSVLHFSSLSINVSALAFLAATDVEDRLRRATEHFVKQSSIQEVSKKIASAGDESSRRS
ncbi:hypothetical protein P692DRAFT_201874756 [Suillus brevipes Sb2]|nr:hypothetical protein P692DRAFT_201874756 [Suillus brevipes Sb2]